MNKIESNVIRFSRNWNNKLSLKYFSSIRIASKKWKVGETYKVYLGDKYLFDSKLVFARKLKYLTNIITYLDAGMDIKQFCELIKKFYKSEFTPNKFVVLIFKKIQ